MPEDRKTIAIVLGTRPEAIKLAPVIRELRRDPDRWDLRVVATAQHRELLDRVLGLFEIRADVDLDIMREDQDLYGVTEKALRGLGDSFREIQPDMVLVQGDTTSVFAGALAAFYQKIPVGHVEAGLRTEMRYSPFPEEINRHLTSVLADLHFAPTSRAAWNLRHEGLDDTGIIITGNTVIDALLDVASREEPPLPEGVDPQKTLILVTAHRRESFGVPLERAFKALAILAERHPECQIVYPVHPNPKVRKAAKENLGASRNIILLEPMDYVPFVGLMKRSKLILTDSGGIQEEAPALGVPVLVLRSVTERPEAVHAGTVKLVGTDPHKILSEAERLLTDPVYHNRMAAATNPYGDGKASERIAQALSHYFFKTGRPKNFSVNA